MSDRPYILIVEDEEAISLLIQYNLEKEGLKTSQAFTSDEALQSIDEKIPDLIILDWMLPGMSGLEIAKDLKSYDETMRIPMIMLTARGEEGDKLNGFDVGIDDYLTKPFSPKELIARIKSVLKRADPRLMEENISYANIKVDNRKKSISLGGIPLKMSPTEYDLLEYLTLKAEKCCSRENLLANVWKDEEIEGRAVDVAIRRIRAILDKASHEGGSLIKTIRGKGYMLIADN